MKKYSFLIGVLIGAICPLLGILIFYFWKASSNPFGYFLQVMVQTPNLLTAAISFALFANVIAFTIAVNTKNDKLARGIFLVTLILTVPALVYKIFFS